MDVMTEFLAGIGAQRDGKFLDYLRGARENVIQDFVSLPADEHLEMVQLQAQVKSYENIITHLESCVAARDKAEADILDPNEY
jgi:hypothetical protein